MYLAERSSWIPSIQDASMSFMRWKSAMWPRSPVDVAMRRNVSGKSYDMCAIMEKSTSSRM